MNDEIGLLLLLRYGVGVKSRKSCQWDGHFLPVVTLVVENERPSGSTYGCFHDGVTSPTRKAQ